MCQQTRVDTAIPYYERFLRQWPTLEALAAASEDEVQRAWAGLGYYSRARNLLAAARACVAAHGGRVPSDEAAAGELPGVGPYTRGALLSICFGRRLPAVDGNVVRVLSRLFRIEDENPRPAVERIAADLVPASSPGDWNQAVMELGATVCAPRSPRCGACPVANLCAARAAGVAGSLPRKAAKKAAPEVAVAVAVCRRGSDVLLVRRPAKGLLASLWAPPCVEGGPKGALSKALPLRVGKPVAAWTHKFTHRTWSCSAYDCKLAGEIEGARFAPPRDLEALPTAFKPAFGMT